MAFLDKLKEAKDKAMEAAEAAAQKAKEEYEKKKEEQAERKAQEEAHRQAMAEKASEVSQEIIDSILSGETGALFAKNTQDEIVKFSKEFYEKILLPANSASSSCISMQPYLDDKKIVKSFGTIDNDDVALIHVKVSKLQEILITYKYLYFRFSLPEDTAFFAQGRVETSKIGSLKFDLGDTTYKLMCNNVEIASYTITQVLQDAITFNNFFECIEKQDFTITDKEIDEIIQKKIGDKIYKQIKKYMIYDDELAIYFAWGLDSLTAKDYIVCTTKQIIIMDREAFGATANVKQLYYEDITSAETIQNTGDSSITGMLFDAAIAAAFKQCDLRITVSGAVTRINTLNKVEAERVIAIYHQYRKQIKQANSQPQVVMAAAPMQPDILDQIEKLASLKDKGILSEEEFTAKKAELLAKL